MDHQHPANYETVESEVSEKTHFEVEQTEKSGIRHGFLSAFVFVIVIGMF